MHQPWITIAMALLFASAGAAGQGREVLKQIPVGGQGRWDALTIDSAARRLYLTRENRVEILDLDNERLLATVPNTPGARDIVLAPEIDRGYVLCAQGEFISIFSLKKLTYLGKIAVGKDPATIVWDAINHRFFVQNRGTNDTSVVDGDDGEIESTVALGGRPQGAVVDGKGKVYVNLEDTNELVELDAKKMNVTRRISLTACQSPSAIAIDSKNHMLFSACANRVVAVTDPDTGQVISTIPVGARIGSLLFDEDTRKLAAAGSDGTMDGTVDIVAETSPGHFANRETVTTTASARTMALDPATHQLFVPVQKLGAAPASRRAGVEPDTFGLLVVGTR